MIRRYRPAWTAALLLTALPAALLGPQAVWAADWPAHAPQCADACPAVCPQCVPVPHVRKETRPVYGCKEESICLPHRSLWDLLCGRADCGPCRACHACPDETCPQCECYPRRKIVLLKKIVPVERPGFRCEPVCPPR